MKKSKKTNKNQTQKIIRKKSNNLKGLRVLIFGASGFIGKATVKTCRDLGAQVTAVSRKEYNALDNSPANSKKLEALVKNKDVIINLMAVVNSHDLVSTEESKTVNIEFPQRLLEVVNRHNPEARVIFSSSQTVYGKTDADSIDESHPTEPETLYARQKREAEKIHETYSQTKKIPVTILRLSNVYGPEAPSNRSVISLFLEKANNDKEITVFGEGDELRDYMYVDDVTEAFALASINPLEQTIYNVGSGYLHSLKEIALTITKQVGKGKIIHIPFPENYARYRGHIILDSQKFKKETGWKAKTKLSQGLKKMRDRL